jgi:hypothetical protein
VVEEGPGKEERHFVSAVELGKNPAEVLGLIGASASFPSKSSPPSSSSSEAECKSKSSLAELNDMSDWDALGLGYRAHQNTQEGG